jgi:hypothetical protein
MSAHERLSFHADGAIAKCGALRAATDDSDVLRHSFPTHELRT